MKKSVLSRHVGLITTLLLIFTTIPAHAAPSLNPIVEHVPNIEASIDLNGQTVSLSDLENGIIMEDETNQLIEVKCTHPEINISQPNATMFSLNADGFSNATLETNLSITPYSYDSSRTEDSIDSSKSIRLSLTVQYRYSGEKLHLHRAIGTNEGAVSSGIRVTKTVLFYTAQGDVYRGGSFWKRGTVSNTFTKSSPDYTWVEMKTTDELLMGDSPLVEVYRPYGGVSYEITCTRGVNARINMDFSW